MRHLFFIFFALNCCQIVERCHLDRLDVYKDLTFHIFFIFSAINDAEKVEIRRNLLQNFGSEQVYQIALQAAVAIGKVARYDVPKDWPELLPALVQAVQADESLVQHRALLVLHHVIKALSSKRLAADRRVFHDMIEELLPFVLPIWQRYHGQMVQIFNSGQVDDESKITPIIEKSILVLKVIRKAIIHGLKKPCENENAMILIKALIDQIRVVLPFSEYFFPFHFNSIRYIFI